MQDRRMTGLVAGEVEAEDSVIHEAARHLGEGQVLRRGHVAQSGHDDATLEAKRFSSLVPAA